MFVGHWLGGMLMFDKQTLATTIQPAPLNPIDSIRPANFQVHHTVPTTDGKFVFIEDEFLNGNTDEKIKVYNITNINSPVYVGGIVGSGNAATSQAHNMVIQPISPGLDRLYVAWYKAGMRMFEVNTTGATPVITETGMHQLRATTGTGFGGMWGVDYLPCTLKGQPHTCIYSSDYEKFGLVVDALGYDPMLDPYAPESAVTNPINNQTITGCSYTISGTAHDYYSGIQRVEVSTDNGGSWQTATGTTTWTYEWTIPGNGPYTIQARAVDVAGNVQTLITGVPVTVTGCTVGATATVPQPTNTAVVPTSTGTAVAPTSTAIAPTNTAVVPTNTSVAPTNTAAVPTSTPVQSTNTVVAATSTPIAATSTPSVCAIIFTDVPSDNTFYTWIRCLACRGVFGGYEDGTFRPFNYVTRGQFSKIASNAAEYDDEIPSDRQTFEDVPPGHPFWLWIERLALHEVIGGYACGAEGEPCVPPGNRPYFRPYADITRGQIAKILCNITGCEIPPGTQQAYEDVLPTDTFWQYIEGLSTLGVMGGYPCGGKGEPCMPPDNRPYFRSHANGTRGQVAKMVSNTFFPNCQTPARP